MDIISSARSIVAQTTKHSDLALVGLLVAVIALMIIPMPTPVVDTLIGANLALSFAILMMTMYVKTPLEFSSFPTMLLFTTLFRVGLNITTTRLILLNADAGEIIHTFGEFALGGNFVVGAVVFLILTVVQFLVISKGAERVAEVGARFTLDAMPGKQMSIDADMRAGAIDMNEAQKRRDEVAQESKMFGAMDGAMKFVKGDSIAGMVVCVVNIVGGTIIGVTQKGIAAKEALTIYGVLTIGDGLVSQIPSLIIAISAGILITRSGDTKVDVGAQIGGQFFNQPKALLISAALVFLISLIPGFPKVQLISLALAIGAFSYVLRRIQEVPKQTDGRHEISQTIRAASAPKERKNAALTTGDDFAPTVPIILDISEDLSNSLNYDSLNDELISLRQALYFDLGVPFPGINLRIATRISDLTYELQIYEIPLSRGCLEPGHQLTRESEETITLLGITTKRTEDFLPNIPSLWVPDAEASKLTSSGITCMSHSQILAYHLSLVLSRHAADFLGLQETKYLLDRMEGKAPDLVHEVTRLLPIQRIAEVFQRLVQEQISIRDLRTILEALIEWSPKEKDMIMLTEYIRGALKRQISYVHSRGQNMLPAILLEPQVEETIRKAIRQTSAGAFLSLDPATSKRFLDAVTEAAGDYQKHTQKPVLLASMDIRRYVRRLIEAKHYMLSVISYQELTPEISVQPLSRVHL